MSFYQIKSLSSAIKTYIVYGACCVFGGIIQGCNVGYQQGYKAAIQDMAKNKENQEQINGSLLEELVHNAPFSHKIEEKNQYLYIPPYD